VLYYPLIISHGHLGLNPSLRGVGPSPKHLTYCVLFLFIGAVTFCGCWLHAWVRSSDLSPDRLVGPTPKPQPEGPEATQSLVPTCGSSRRRRCHQHSSPGDKTTGTFSQPEGGVPRTGRQLLRQARNAYSRIVLLQAGVASSFLIHSPHVTVYDRKLNACVLLCAHSP
jgi:hypothetical protein